MVPAAYAQAAQAAAPSPADANLNMFIVLAITAAIFYFMIIRPQQKKQKETEAMLASIRKGDRVLTSGGIFGTVIGVKDDVVVLKVADEVKMEFSKQSVVQIQARSD
jgi:preprotein translocase subunit YajC